MAAPLSRLPVVAAPRLRGHLLRHSRDPLRPFKPLRLLRLLRLLELDPEWPTKHQCPTTVILRARNRLLRLLLLRLRNLLPRLLPHLLNLLPTHQLHPRGALAA